MQLEYEIKFSKRKTLNITVERDRKIIVRAPLNLSIEKIEEIVQSKRQWLKEKIPQKFQRNKRLSNTHSMLFNLNLNIP